jgi:hypothetical protein
MKRELLVLLAGKRAVKSIPISSCRITGIEGIVPEGRGELELGLQPIVERPSYRFALLLPDEIGAHRNHIFGFLGTRVEHIHSCRYCNQRKRGQLFDDPPGVPVPFRRQFAP